MSYQYKCGCVVKLEKEKMFGRYVCTELCNCVQHPAFGKPLTLPWHPKDYGAIHIKTVKQSGRER